MHLPTRKQ